MPDQNKNRAEEKKKTDRKQPGEKVSLYIFSFYVDCQSAAAAVS